MTRVDITFEPPEQVRGEGGSIPVKRTVGVVHEKFPSGGSWSYFLCPQCGRKARTLRLLDNSRPVCRWCDGLLYRCQTHDPRAPLERVARLEELVSRARCKNRSQLSMSLRRAIIVMRRRAMFHAKAELNED